jgi:alpha-tubulin suppressor-like RCC1 family protein
MGVRMLNKRIILAVIALMASCVLPISVMSAVKPMVAIGYGQTLIVKDDGTVWEWKKQDDKLIKDKELVDVVSVAAGNTHRVALKSDGTVWIRRQYYYYYDQTGRVKTIDNNSVLEQVAELTNVIAIAAGYEYSIALRNDGSVWIWGNAKPLNTAIQSDKPNQVQRKNGSFSYSTVPVKVEGLTDIVVITKDCSALKNDGTVWMFNAQKALEKEHFPDYTPTKVDGLVDITLISSEGNLFTALKKDGTVWIWSIDQYGLLEYVGINRANVLIQALELTEIAGLAAGGQHVLALKKDGTVWAWGKNSSGQLGDGTAYDSLLPIQVKGLTAISSIVASGDSSIAVQKDGSIWSWGIGNFKKVLTPTQIIGLTDVTAIAAGYAHGLALKSDGTVWGWGNNTDHQLMWLPQYKYCQPVHLSAMTDITKIAAYGNENAAVTKDGTVWNWGEEASRRSPSRIRSYPFYIAGFRDVADISVGRHHVVALKKDGSVWSWGGVDGGRSINDKREYRNSYLPQKENGLTDIMYVSSAQTHTLAIRNDGTVWEWDRLDSLGPTLKPIQVAGLTDVVSVQCGSFYSMALKRDGTVWVWGQIRINNSYGSSVPVQIIGLNDVIAIAAGREALAVKKDGSLWTWGLMSGVPEYLNTIKGFKAVAVSEGYFAVLKNDGTVWSWGFDSYCQLGIGNGSLLPQREPFSLNSAAQ